MMKTMMFDNVEVQADTNEFSADELKYYVEVAKSKFPKMTLTHLKVELSTDGGVDLKYRFEGVKFERIRRITGYLTGDLNSWNNAKRAEESERVKHDARLA